MRHPDAPVTARWPLVQVAVDDFPKWLLQFDEGGPFRKPDQLALHRRTIDLRRELGSGAAALADDRFIQSLYDTLIAWGIGARASKLKPFGEFAASLRTQAESISVLQTLLIDQPELAVDSVSESIWRTIADLDIVENDAKLVSGTKALHHLLPDLVVPMDRAYTQAFFGWQNPQFQYGQRDRFKESFLAFRYIAVQVAPNQYVGDRWRSSRTKVIDNAVVAVVQHLRAEIAKTAG